MHLKTWATNTISLIFILIGTSQVILAQPETEPCKQATSLMVMMQKFHFNPLVLTDSVDDDIYTNFYKNLDPENIFFLKTDINSFSQDKPKFSGKITDAQVCNFLELVTLVYKTRLAYADTLATNILQKPFVYNLADSVVSIQNYIPHFAENEDVLKSRWVRKLKYSVLWKLYTLNDSIDPLKITSHLSVSEDARLRENVLKQQKRAIQGITSYESGIKDYVTEAFFNAIVNRFDPHSSYFSPETHTDFINTLSVEAKAFGLGVTENKNGEIIVRQITPGGPAWESGQINNGDILYQVKLYNGAMIDLTFASEEEVNTILNSSSYNKLTFYFRKQNGLKSEVPLEKAKIKVEENAISGFILQGGRKVGYIPLPDFYTDYNQSEPNGLANDVAKEIVKMQKDNIEGLIIDLRFNGGGAIEEAIGLAGIFIDEGPLFIQKFTNEKPQLVKDFNRGTIYNGPLLIMVNCFSASASELVASVLQDYNRAVIVGSQTFGKATGQIGMPLDTNFSFNKPPTEFAQNAFLKITMEKLYKLDGSSYQKLGLKPDIELPDFYSSLNINEASLPYSLEQDRIEKKVVFKALPELPVDSLSYLSQKRIINSQVYTEIKRINDSLNLNKNKTRTIKLNPESFAVSSVSRTGFIDKIEKMMEKEADSVPYKISGNNFNMDADRNNQYKMEQYEATTRQMKEDIYIREAYMIINDLANFKNN